MQALLVVVEIMVAVALVVSVLLQRSEGGALGMGGGGSGLGGLFSPRGAADTLTRTTAILAAVFLLTCIVLNRLSLSGHSERSLLDSQIGGAVTTPLPSRPALPLPGAPGPAVPKPH